MKKLIAIALIAVMVLGLAACGTVNEKEVSVLWSGDGVVSIPNSLINAVERAMYIENIFYKHYGANGDQAAQTKQAEDALEAGCSALVVELVDVDAAQAIVDAAKAKNVPLVFINSAVDAAVVNSYNKCAAVDTNLSSLSPVLGELIGKSLYEEKKKVISLVGDRNEDGKISYIALGEVTATVDEINKVLADKELPALELLATADSYAAADIVAAKYANAELILTDNDTTAQEVLVTLQANGYNKDKLKTHLIPVYTVGNTADYKALVLAGKPAGAHTDDNVQEYFKSMQYIVDLRTVEEADLPSMIYTTGDIISDGRLAGTAIEDYDSIAVSVASALATLLKGEALTEAVIQISYTTLE